MQQTPKALTKFRTTALALTLALITTGAYAQSHRPYAGLETRPVKALSEQQIADLRAGRGMSMALPAELNGYPGPVHVIELADKLALSEGQRSQIQRMYDDMKREAVALGERLIDEEKELDRQFAGHTVTAAKLTEATAAIAKTQGLLRATHLRFHLLTFEILTPEQRRHYAELRGYGQPEPHRSHPH